MKIFIDEREHSLYEKCQLFMNQTPNPHIVIIKQVLQLGDMIIKSVLLLIMYQNLLQ